MPFLIVQRYNGSLSALTRSSPADGEKNLHRRISLFQGGIAIFYIHAVVFISPNLAGLGCRREYRHDKNTAYSGSLDARSDKTNPPPINQAKECALALTIEREVEAIEHSRVT